MSNDPGPDPIIKIGPLRSSDLPEGWKVEPFEWNGESVQVGFDPRFQVMRVEHDTFADAVTAARRACATWSFTDEHEAALQDLEREFTAAAATPAPPGMLAVATAARLACDTPQGSGEHEEALGVLGHHLQRFKDRYLDKDALRRAGWARAMTDPDGHEVWVRSHARAAEAALDQMAAPTEPPSAAVVSAF